MSIYGTKLIYCNSYDYKYYSLSTNTSLSGELLCEAPSIELEIISELNEYTINTISLKQTQSEKTTKTFFPISKILRGKIPSIN